MAFAKNKNWTDSGCPDDKIKALAEHYHSVSAALRCLSKLDQWILGERKQRNMNDLPDLGLLLTSKSCERLSMKNREGGEWEKK